MIPMKPIPGVPDKSQIKAGMAWYSDTGPFGTTCGTCLHRGYYRDSTRTNKRTGEVEDVRRKHNGCTLFRKWAGHDGPVVETDWKSCKHYEATS